MLETIPFLVFLLHATQAEHQCEPLSGADCITEGTSLLQLKSSLARDSTTAVRNIGKIPCYIHQTWITNDISQIQDVDMQRVAKTFRAVNSGCQHKIWSDQEVDHFMKTFYPDIAAAFPVLKPVERADIFRYAIIHKMGGFYADMDVLQIKPFRSWGVPADTELVVGYETEHPLAEGYRQNVGFTRSEQIEQWFFGAVAGHPALEKCLELFEKRRQWGIEETTEFTGPGLFSDAVHEYLWSASASRAGKSIEELETELQMQRKARHEEPYGQRSTLMEKGQEVTITEEGNASMTFKPGRGPEGSHAFILSANQVAAGSLLGGKLSEKTLIHHLFKGTWKKK